MASRLTMAQAGVLRATILRALADGPLLWHELVRRTLAAQPEWDPVRDGEERPVWTAEKIRAQLRAVVRRRGYIQAIKKPGQGVLWERTNKL